MITEPEPVPKSKMPPKKRNLKLESPAKKSRRASTKVISYVDEDSEDEGREDFTDDEDEDYYE